MHIGIAAAAAAQHSAHHGGGGIAEGWRGRVDRANQRIGHHLDVHIDDFPLDAAE